MVTDHCQFLEWDSAFFRCRIARITTQRLSSSEMQRILMWCNAQSIDCLYFLVDSKDIATVRLAEEKRFRLVDLRVTLERRLQSGSELRKTEAVATIRPATSADIPSLRAIARVSHGDSRFYADENFAHDAGALFEMWIENSYRSHANGVLVAEWTGRPVGYITCEQIDGCYGQIKLLAVAPQSQKHGVGWALVEAAVSWFAQNNIERVMVVTQGKNEQAQRLYQRSGFWTTGVQLWYHYWFTEAPAQAISYRSSRAHRSSAVAHHVKRFKR